MGAALSRLARGLSHVPTMTSPEGKAKYKADEGTIVAARADKRAVRIAIALRAVVTDVVRTLAGGAVGAGTAAAQSQPQDWGPEGEYDVVGDGGKTRVYKLPADLAAKLFAVATTLPTGAGPLDFVDLRREEAVQTIVAMSNQAPTVRGQPLRKAQCYIMVEVLVHRRLAAQFRALADAPIHKALADDLLFLALMADTVHVILAPGEGKTAAALLSLYAALSPAAVTGDPTNKERRGAALVVAPTTPAQMWKKEIDHVMFTAAPALRFAAFIDDLKVRPVSTTYSLNVITLPALEMVRAAYASGPPNKMDEDINKLANVPGAVDLMKNDPLNHVCTLAHIYEVRLGG